MKRVKLGLIAFGFIAILIELVFTDYGDLTWTNNWGSYLGIISMILLILSMVFSIRQENKREK